MIPCPDCGEVLDEVRDVLDHRAIKHKIGRVVGESEYALTEHLKKMQGNVDELEGRVENLEQKLTNFRHEIKDLTKQLQDVLSRSQLSVPLKDRISKEVRQQMEKMVGKTGKPW